TDVYPSLVMINPHIPGLEAVRQDGRSSASTLWKVVIGGKEDQYQSAIKIDSGGFDVVYDLGGDGRHQIAAAIVNEHGDGSALLVLFDAATGARIAEAGDERIVSADDLDGDGVPEILLKSESRLRMAHLRGRELIETWRSDRVEPLSHALPAEGSLA